MPETIMFLSDKVTIKTGRVDNSAIVSFEVGEYSLDDIAPLVSITDKVLRITVEVDE